MPYDMDHDELYELCEDVFRALDDVADVDTPGVARLALTSISMLRYVETAVVNIASKDLDTVEELRNRQKSKLTAATMTQHIVKRLIVTMAKSVLTLRETVDDLVRKLEAREDLAQDLDDKIRIARETEAEMCGRLSEPVKLLSAE
ncbi:hypothetical protein E4T38_01937 [Aureobasidium subglaciale]|nr:hypothetical protein E4T38_01937 [Aureobasidium subglaciale]KAI5229399.1 hypothetical protein E4T40_01543 [Aureobasidium subglaciale]KAI5233027.1 hypothetical protein E4T41_01935 [Aureobasidium subglaciale]KAI5266320.1 hypothetical protein E4T46_01540 [Aureobasidium subglaciale]